MRNQASPLSAVATAPPSTQAPRTANATTAAPLSSSATATTATAVPAAGAVAGSSAVTVAQNSSSARALRTIPSAVRIQAWLTGLLGELGASTEPVFRTRLTWMLALGPLAVMGDFTGLASQTVCFCLAGLALIPCAERLSFVTEQVAMHTNGTIGGLLNATFGNAPELLIATAAMRSGYYRITQLVMLGSMLTNMLLVFGIACAIGGARWQVQELRTTSGNANVVMLYVAVAGCLLPAALRLSGQYNNYEGVAGKYNEDAISPQEVTFCRVNAVVLFVLYLCFLVFQLGTHSDEFADDSANRRSRRYARRNHAFRWFAHWLSRKASGHTPLHQTTERLPFLHTDDAANPTEPPANCPSGNLPVSDRQSSVASFDEEEAQSANTSRSVESLSRAVRRRGGNASGNLAPASAQQSSHIVPNTVVNGSSHAISHNQNSVSGSHRAKSKTSDWEDLESEDGSSRGSRFGHHSQLHQGDHDEVPLLSMRMGILWLLILTLCISSMSDILVDTIDDFAFSMHLSEVFTSMVVIPFFSNVAEQVSAFIFAYRNEMDLCVAVTIGSAVQIATFVLPGTVIIGMTLQRSMTLYFGAYETCCLFFSVVVVGAVLQSGTSNWLTGFMLVGIYIILASGIWFHQQENLTVDEESSLAWKGDPTEGTGG